MLVSFEAFSWHVL